MADDSRSRLFQSLRRFVPGAAAAERTAGHGEPVDALKIEREAPVGETIAIPVERLNKLRDAVTEGQQIIAAAWQDVATRLEVVRRHCDGRCAEGVRDELIEAIALHQQLLNRTTRLLAGATELLKTDAPGSGQSLRRE